ncbi:PGF-pre-PGF domain protein [Candidatus Micrarchaeum sp.]|nr:PGF-pre-PGF domain protein [Candidatus Micrarchaeum sp.]
MEMKGYLITICIFIMALSISSAQALGTANYNSIVPSQANNQNQNGIGNTYPNGLAYPENELSSMYSNLFNKSMIKGINSHFLANISKNLVAYGIGQSFQNGSYVYKINAVYPKNGDINSIGNETFSLRIIKPIVGSDGSVILKSNSAYIPSMIKVPIIYNGSNLLLNLSVKLDSSYKNEITDIVLSKTPPPNLESRFSGTPYYYIHVNSSINDTNVIDANYTFAVNKSWINSQNISPGQVALYKYVGGKWMEMPTLLIGNNSTAYFYDGESDSLSDYVISYSTGSATGSANPLSVTLPAGYKLYLCDAGANYTFSTTAANSWTALQNATSPSSPPPAASVGYQTNNVCTAYTPAIKGRRNAYTVGLAVAGIGLNITNYNFYGASANSSTTASLTYPVTVNGSFVAILVASGYYGLTGLPTVPSGCSIQQITTNATSYESAYISTCNNVQKGSYNATASNGDGGATVIGSFVFPPGNVILDDNPTGAGSIFTNNKTYTNGQNSLLLGKGEISAKPANNFVFTNWSVSNANLTVQNAYAQTTNLTVVGNGILTANYNGITTFSESGLPSGATWSVVYDGITNSSALSSISFDTVPGSHTFAIANVTYNGKTYIAKPSSGSVVAGNVTSVAFSEEGVLSLVVSSNRTAYDTSDIVTATAPLPSQSIEILIGQGTAKGVLVSSGTGSASCNLYSTCNANVPLAAGLYNVSAYLPSTGNVISEEVNITKASPSLTLSVPNSYVYDGSGGTIDFGISSYNNQLQGTLYVNNASVASTFSSNTYTTSASVGNYSIAFKTSGNVNYTSASRTGKFSIYPKLYTVNYTSAGAVGTTDTLSVSTSTGYDIYLCDGGTSYGTLTYTTGTIDLSNTYSYIGNQTTNTCTETTTGPDLAEAILGVKALHTYTLYDSSGTATDSFTYNVVKNDSFVAIMLSSGYYGLSSAPTVPSGCIEKVYDTGGDTYESSYIAICQSQIAGQYTVSSSSTLGGYITAGAYVFSPYQLVLDDNPIAGTITTNGKTFANGQTTNVIGTGTITANPPKNFVFTNWGVSNANLTVQNAYAQTTNLTVVGNGILTASYNGITTFSESGLPSGAPWSVVYDGITNSSALSSISFDTAPGSYTFAIANVTYNGKTYIAKPSSGSVVAGNVTSVAFSEEGVLSLVLSSNKTAYDISDIVTARAPLPSQSIEILIGQGTAKGVLVSSGTGSASCNLYSTCNANVPLAAGLYNVSAYLPSTGNVISEEVNITKASPSLTLSVPNSYVYDGSGGTIDFGISSYNNQLQGTLYVNNASVASTFSSNTYTTSASVGNYSIAFKTSGNVNYTSASKTGNFSIAPKLYTVNSTEALNSSTTDTLTAYAHANYLTYICDGGAGTAAVTYTTGTVSQYSGGDDSYIGEQTTDACTETTTGPDLAEAAAGVYAKPSYSLYKGSYTYGGTLDYKVNETGSLVVVAISSGGGEISGIPSALSGCYSKGIESGSDGLESAYIAICQDQKAGSYSIAESVSSGENFAMAAYVFPPYALTMDDNPVAGTITTNGKTFANGQTTNVIGTGTITANPPKNFVFTNWSVSNANLTVQNAYAQTTNLTVVGNGILTASYNGITTFYESGLPSGTLWNLTYDGFKNASTGNYISFDTVPGPHSYAVGNVLINGYNYTPSVYSSTLTAGNTTIIKFTPPVCTISLNTNTISFGNLDPGTIYPDSVQIIDTNSGDATANILLSGTNWTNPTINFGATNTSWSITSLSSFGPNLLSRSPRNTAISIGPSSSNSIYFGLNVPGAIPAGTYTQTIVIENSC